MLNIKKLSINNFSECYSLIEKNKKDIIYFEKLGWKLNQFKEQLIKENNFSLAIYKGDLMISFVIGDIISIEKIIEYEILLIYVNFKSRNLGYASKLLNEIPLALRNNHLKKIYLEVSSNNCSAINLYNNNNFINLGVRRNYYQHGDKNFDALLFEKKIYE